MICIDFFFTLKMYYIIITNGIYLTKRNLLYFIYFSVS